MRTAVLRINLEVLMGWEERGKRIGWDRQSRVLWERWRASSNPFSSSKHYNAQDWAGFGLEVSPTFSIVKPLSLLEGLGDRHFQTVTQPILKPIQSRWNGLLSGGVFPCLERRLDAVPSFLMTELGKLNPTLYFHLGWGKSYRRMNHMASLILFALEQNHVHTRTYVCVYIHYINSKAFYWSCRGKHMIEMPESRLSVHEQ